MADTIKILIIATALLLMMIYPAAALLELTDNYVNGTADWELKKSDGYEAVMFTSNTTDTINLVSVYFKGTKNNICHYTVRVFSNNPGEGIPDYQLGFVQTKEVNDSGWNNFISKDEIRVIKGTQYWVVLNSSSNTDYFSLLTGSDIDKNRAVSTDGENWDAIPASAFDFKVFLGELTDVDVKKVVTTTADDEAVAICEQAGGTPLELRNSLFCKINGTYKTVDEMLVDQDTEVTILGKQTYNLGALISPSNPSLGWGILILIIIVVIMFYNDQRFVGRERKRRYVERTESKREEKELKLKDRRRLRPDGGYY
jgi:hypothetical protein